MTKKNLKSIILLCYSALLCASCFISFYKGTQVIPIVIQNMLAVLGGVLFGGVSGAATTGIFLMTGALGAPVFAGFNGGMETLSGFTGGYLTGYFIAALVSGFYCKTPNQEEKTPLMRLIIGTVLGFLIIYLMGTIQYIRTHDVGLSLTSLQASLYICVIPYIPYDIIKAALIVIIARHLRPIVAKYL